MIYPHGSQKLLPESASQRKITPRVLIFHSAAAAGSPYRFFLNGTNLESHFWIGLDGRVEQYMDTNVQADANYHANPFAISVETENHPGTKNWDADPWTSAQLDAAVTLGDWAARQHPIARQLCPTWDGTGFGWHIQFGSPGKWTPVNKACPGKERIRQFKATVLPGIVAAGQPTNKPKPPEDDMPYTPQQIQDFAAKGVRAELERAGLVAKSGDPAADAPLTKRLRGVVDSVVAAVKPGK